MLLFAASGVKRESFYMRGWRIAVDNRDVLSKTWRDDCSGHSKL
jgi:hypothetical protein